MCIRMSACVLWVDLLVNDDMQMEEVTLYHQSEQTRERMDARRMAREIREVTLHNKRCLVEEVFSHSHHAIHTDPFPGW